MWISQLNPNCDDIFKHNHNVWKSIPVPTSNIECSNCIFQLEKTQNNNRCPSFSQNYNKRKNPFKNRTKSNKQVKTVHVWSILLTLVLGSSICLWLQHTTCSFANYIVPTIYSSCWKNGTHYTPPTAFRSPNSLIGCGTCLHARKRRPKPQSICIIFRHCWLD